jgi:hypothetical protein
MHRCGPGFLLTLTIGFVVALTGCLGKSTSNLGSEGVSSVTLSPSPTASMEVGTSRVFSAAGKNAAGGSVLGVNIQYVVQSGNNNLAAPLSVASNGNACAGTWDATVSICNPGTPGIAIVTAVINGVSSTPTTVYVHNHVASIQITDPNQPPYQYDCFPQGQTYEYEATAFDASNNNISNTVGPMTWSSSNTGVVTTTATVTGNPGNQVNFVKTTAKAPGVTQLFASVSGTTSTPFNYTTCLIKAIYLQIGGESQAGNLITVNSGATIAVRAIAIDTLYNVADFGPVPAPPLTWSTTNPEVAAFSPLTNTTGTNNATARNNFGGATLTASCTPPTCNVGLPGPTPTGLTEPSLPIYASDCNASAVISTPCPLPVGTIAYGSVSVDVTAASGAKPPTYTAWAATNGCGNLSGCSSALFSVTAGATPIGPIESLPRTPNSMMFNHLASPRLYIGTDEGLMYVTVGTSPTVNEIFPSPTPCNVALCGKVLTISNDGSFVVVSDTISTPNQVYIYNGGSTTAVAPVDLIIPGQSATAAAFSPDELKLFILTNAGNLYVYSMVDALSSVSGIANAVTDVKFSSNGSFAYLAGTPAPTDISAYATCDTPASNVVSGNLPLASTTYPTLPQLATTPPFALFPIPTQQLDSVGDWTQIMLVLDPPNVNTFGINTTQAPLLDGHYVCNPPVVSLDTHYPQTSASLGQSSTPIYATLGADATELIVVEQNVPAVLVFNIANGTTTSVPLLRESFGSGLPLAAASSTDGSEVFVAACDQYDQSTTPPACAAASVHIVSTTGAGDFQQVPYVNATNDNNHNMCNNGGNGTAPQCLPNMIAIKPN